MKQNNNKKILSASLYGFFRLWKQKWGLMFHAMIDNFSKIHSQNWLFICKINMILYFGSACDSGFMLTHTSKSRKWVLEFLPLKCGTWVNFPAPIEAGESEALDKTHLLSLCLSLSFCPSAPPGKKKKVWNLKLNSNRKLSISQVVTNWPEDMKYVTTGNDSEFLLPQ